MELCDFCGRLFKKVKKISYIKIKKYGSRRFPVCEQCLIEQKDNIIRLQKEEAK